MNEDIEEKLKDKELKKIFDHRDALRMDLVIFLNKLTDADLLAYPIQYHIEGYWESLQKAAQEEINFKLEG
jgi:hypothetical protein